MRSYFKVRVPRAYFGGFESREQVDQAGWSERIRARTCMILSKRPSRIDFAPFFFFFDPEDPIDVRRAWSAAVRWGSGDTSLVSVSHIPENHGPWSLCPIIGENYDVGRRAA